ncbi:MAG: hypothetical protein CFE45_27775, partial [Burkholderiales bacterium PBB5]
MVDALPGGLSFLFELIEFALLAGGVAGLYRYVPNTHVRWGHAWAGGLFVAIGFELAKRALGWYVKSVPTISVVYGAFATVPIFLLWIYLSWLIVLLGAVVAAYAPSLALRVVRLPDRPGERFALAVAVLRALVQARAGDAHGLSVDALAGQIRIDPLQVEPVLEDLAALGWCGRLDEEGAQRHVLLIEPARTPAQPLVDRLLLAEQRSTAAFRQHSGLARMTVARSPVALPVVAGALPARNSLFALFCLTGLCVFITLVSIPFAGATAADGSITPVLLAFRKFLFFVPTAMFLITLAEYKGSGTQRNFAHVLLLVVLFLMFRPWLQRKGVQVFWLVLVLLVLFPLSSLFTHVRFKYLSEDDFKLTVLSDHFLSTHYDAWANVYTSIEMVGRNGLSAGKQLLGALLFYVPSSWWPGKPLATGIEIGNFLENYY